MTSALLTEPVLVVRQRAKPVELTTEHVVLDQRSRQIGAVRQVGQSGARRTARLLTSYDQLLTQQLEVVDAHGAPVLTLTRPATLTRSRVVVRGPEGDEVGQLVQQNRIGRVRFGLHAGGRQVGSMVAEDRRAWNLAVRDHTGVEVARITRTWAGFATTLLTRADHHVLQVHGPLPGALRPLVVAVALSLGVALPRGGRAPR